MGYFEESKACQLFDLVKKEIITKCNMIFDKNTFGLGLLKSPSGPSYSDLFSIVEDTKSTIAQITTSTSSLTFVP